MMQTVHKFVVPVGDEPTEVELPRIAQIVNVGQQTAHQITVWYERPFEEVYAKPYEKRRFQTYGTGHPIPMDAVYVGTIIEGIFVWHLYERHNTTEED